MSQNNLASKASNNSLNQSQNALNSSRRINIGGATDSTKHSIEEDDQEQFTLHINEALKNDKDLAAKLPIDGKSFDALYEATKDGLLLRYTSCTSC